MSEKKTKTPRLLVGLAFTLLVAAAATTPGRSQGPAVSGAVPVATNRAVISGTTEFPSRPSRHFSPNLDGVKDRLVVPLSIKDNGYLEKWKVIIGRKATGGFDAVRTFESTSAKEIQRLTAGKFFKRLVEKKERIAIPPRVEWDGLVETPQGTNKILTRGADGLYGVQIVAINEWGNESATPWIGVVLDTVAPEITGALEFPVFSPNGDGNKETNTLSLRTRKVEILDTIRIEVRDASNRAVGVWDLGGDRFKTGDHRFVFTGKDPSGRELPEGPYTFRVSAFDLAGNSNAAPPIAVRLVRTIETLDVRPTAAIFSPSGRGFHETVALAIQASSLVGLESWNLEIAALSGSTARRVWSGRNDLGELVTFDGKDDSGKIMPDGVYRVLLSNIYDSGNRPGSRPVTVEIDTTPPTLNAKALFPNFIPVASSNKAGRRVMSFEQAGIGRAGDLYSGEILDENKNVVWTKVWGSNAPATFDWDGKNNAGDIVPGSYRYAIRGGDAVANTSRLETAPFDLIGEEAQASAIPDLTAFSPGKGNGRDAVKFKVDITRRNLVTNQIFRLWNEKRVEVRRFEANAFSELTTWDGLDGASNRLPDGRYYYGVDFVMTTGETPSVSGRFVVLKTLPVRVRAIAAPEVFSPNGDGRSEILPIAFSAEPSAFNAAQDQVTLSIRDGNGKTWRAQTWTNQVPGRFDWDGKDQTGSPAPEGDYVAAFDTLDVAANRTNAASKPFALVRKLETVDLALSRFTISPAKRETVEVVPTFSSSRFFKAWQVELSDGKGTRYLLGRKTDASPFIWSTGKDLSGKPVPDGRYKASIQAEYASGNQPVSGARELVVSGKGPDIRLITQPEYFSPDSDGVDDLLRIGLKISHPLGVARSEMALYRKASLPGGKGKPQAPSLSNYLAAGQRPFKTWKLPEGEIDVQLEWDGKGDDGTMVESANDYVFFVSAQDAAGNQTALARAITVDVLIERLADGRLRIILNSITFGFNSSRLEGEYGRVLDRLLYILAKFPEYRIHIVGHTDSRGEDRHNLELSAARAKSVHQYLVEHDVASGRLTTEGKGRTELLVSPEENADTFIQEENYRKNRRVEFFLKKEEKK